MGFENRSFKFIAWCKNDFINFLLTGDETTLVVTNDQDEQEEITLNGLYDHNIFEKHEFTTTLKLPGRNRDFSAKVIAKIGSGVVSGQIDFEDHGDSIMNE